MVKKKQKPTVKKDAEYYEIHPLILDLKSKNGLVRERAREKLVAIGAPAVTHLAKLTSQRAAILRWEAVKALGQIADPGSTPVFITALRDKDEEVRWLAAEGLIAVGAGAIEPLLQELVKKSKSVLLRKGAHHYFSALRDLEESSRFDDLLSALESPEAKLNTPIAVEKLLKIMQVKYQGAGMRPKNQ